MQVGTVEVCALCIYISLHTLHLGRLSASTSMLACCSPECDGTHNFSGTSNGTFFRYRYWHHPKSGKFPGILWYRYRIPGNFPIPVPNLPVSVLVSGTKFFWYHPKRSKIPETGMSHSATQKRFKFTNLLSIHH